MLGSETCLKSFEQSVIGEDALNLAFSLEKLNAKKCF